MDFGNDADSDGGYRDHYSHNTLVPPPAPAMRNDEMRQFILSAIAERKSILFGAFSETLTKEMKAEGWKGVIATCEEHGFHPCPGKSWRYLRDTVWPNYKNYTARKRERMLACQDQGGSGSKPSAFTANELKVLDILGLEPYKGSPTVSAVVKAGQESDDILARVTDDTLGSDDLDDLDGGQGRGGSLGLGDGSVTSYNYLGQLHEGKKANGLLGGSVDEENGEYSLENYIASSVRMNQPHCGGNDGLLLGEPANKIRADAFRSKTVYPSVSNHFGCNERKQSLPAQAVNSQISLMMSPADSGGCADNGWEMMNDLESPGFGPMASSKSSIHHANPAARPSLGNYGHQSHVTTHRQVTTALSNKLRHNDAVHFSNREAYDYFRGKAGSNYSRKRPNSFSIDSGGHSCGRIANRVELEDCGRGHSKPASRECSVDLQTANTSSARCQTCKGCDAKRQSLCHQRTMPEQTDATRNRELEPGLSCHSRGAVPLEYDDYNDSRYETSMCEDWTLQASDRTSCSSRLSMIEKLKIEKAKLELEEIGLRCENFRLKNEKKRLKIDLMKRQLLQSNDRSLPGSVDGVPELNGPADRSGGELLGDDGVKIEFIGN